jgi:ADP-ribose pyrophosphatase YjhB (NUDIX family)
MPSEAPVDAADRELFEENSLTLTVDDLTMLSGNPLRVPLPASQHKLVHLFSASVHVPYVIANLRTPTKVEQAVNP